MLALVIGCGSIGKRHIRNLVALDAAEVIGCDATIERRREAEEQSGIRTYESLERALDEKPDVAVICVPTSLHVPVAMSAARRGCHLFVEKPLSHTLDGVVELTRVATEKGLVTLVGCNMRFHPGIALVRQLLQEATVGRVVCARVQAGQYLPDWHPWEDYRRGYSANRSLGGGVILDGIHEIDYVRWLLGEVTRVFCMSGIFSSLEIDTEDMAEILVSFESGAIGEIHLDYIQRSYGRSCQIIGEEGTIHWDFAEGQVRVYSARTKQWQVLSYGPDHDVNTMYVEEMKHFLECVNGRANSVQDLVQGRRVLEIALAAKESARTGTAMECRGAA